MNKARELSHIAMFAALLALCAWIAVPTAVPVTLQTLGVFLAGGLLGGRKATAAVGLYILMAAAGLPVLAGFRGGAGALLGSTGGYVLGFLLITLTMWAAEKLPVRSLPVRAAAMTAGLALCYAFGTAWFMAVYARGGGAAAARTVLGWCVAPFVLPDLGKIAAALWLTERLKRHIR